MDLFGGEISSNAAQYFGSGLKGRWREAKDYTDHRCLSAMYALPQVKHGALEMTEVPLRNAVNEQLRQDYAADCARVLTRWNKALKEEGMDVQLSLPSTRFFRRQGLYARDHFDTEGKLISEFEFEANRTRWLPSDEDRAYVQSLMVPVVEPGKVANWIAAPSRGIHGQALDYEYVRS
jgi:benzoyl-CoA 2,3-dioxygenase component B